MLGESGRTMSNMDMLEMLSNRNIRDILGETGKTISNMDRSIAAGMGSPMMSDNEPRMEDRDQIFSIDVDIKNLMKSYNMLVEDQDFVRAQEVADMIDQKQQQKIAIQGMNARRQMVEDNFDLPPSPGPKPAKELPLPPQQDEITRILDSISI